MDGCPGWIWNGDREDAGVLIVHAVKLNAVIRPEGSQPQALPAEQVFGYRQGDPWAFRRKRRVSHYVAPERFDKRDTRILAAAATVASPLVIRFGLQCNTEPLDARRVAGLIKPHACDADARVIAPRDQPREEVKLTIRATRGSWVQDAFGLQRIARLRLHHQPKALQLKSRHRLTSQRSWMLNTIQTSDDCLANPLSLIGISDLDRNNACFLGRIVVATREQAHPL